MLLIAVVDSNAKEASASAAMIEDYLTSIKQTCMVRIYHSSLDFIRSTDSHDIVCLDMSLDKIDGLETARLLRKINPDTPLFFITSRADLAIKGYEVDALNYIIKPAAPSAIQFTLDKALKKLKQVSNVSLALKTTSGIISIASNDISYVEVFDHNLVYHTSKGNYEARGRLSDVIARLDPQRFALCNRSFVVNLQQVTSIKNDYLTVDDTQIYISKSHYKQIMKHFSMLFGSDR